MQQLEKQFNYETRERQRFGGWGVASAWHEGLSDHEIQHTVVCNRNRNVQFKFNRAEQEFNRILELLNL